MRVLVTGGAGFIGSHLCEALLRAGHRVDVIDDLSTGRRENIRHLERDPRFSWELGSVTDRDFVWSHVAAADRVFHLAAAVGVELVAARPVKTIETNVQGTDAVLTAACERRTAVTLTSTSEVYGKSDNLPFSEDGELVFGPPHVGRWAYACSKALDEFMAFAYRVERDLPVTVVRLFNTVGPRQTGRYGMVLPRLVGQALSGLPLTVYGDGLQTRSFCHVADVVRGLVALAEHPRAEGSIYNLGGTEEISILSLARRIIALTRSRSEISLIPYSDVFRRGFEDMDRRRPSTAKVFEAIGWRPERSLDDIILDVARARTDELRPPVAPAEEIVGA